MNFKETLHVLNRRNCDLADFFKLLNQIPVDEWGEPQNIRGLFLALMLAIKHDSTRIAVLETMVKSNPDN